MLEPETIQYLKVAGCALSDEQIATLDGNIKQIKGDSRVPSEYEAPRIILSDTSRHEWQWKGAESYKQPAD